MPIYLIAERIALVQVNLAQARPLIGALIPYNQLIELVVSTLVFSLIGLVMFAVAYLIMDKATPFSLRKELEEDHNVALAIVIASVIIGIALIVSAAVHG
jgi:putative membrane protein